MGDAPVGIVQINELGICYGRYALNNAHYGFVKIKGFDTIPSMTKLLALETSGAVCSVVAWSNGERFEDTRNVERMHNQVLLPMLDDVLQRAAVAPVELDLVAFGAGPGSFTGVRIAAAVAQAVSLAADALVVPVSSTRAMLQAWTDTSSQLPSREASRRKVVCAIRSRANAYYLAGYESDGDGWQLVLPDALYEEWPAQVLDGDWLCVGQRPDWTEHAGAPRRSSPVTVTAGPIAELGFAASRADDGLDPALALPRYVSGDMPWRSS